MREIKFVTHLTRNFYLYFIVYLVSRILFNHQVDLSTFLLGLFAYALGYAPVYFLNDSQDWKEDKQLEKDNLYTAINNPALFWIITASLVFIGAYLGLLVSSTGYIFMLLLYLSNIFHSAKPFVVRKKVFIGSVNYFILSVFKFYLIIYYLKLVPNESLLAVMVLFASIATFAGLMYKRHKQKNISVEYLFGSILAASMIISIIQYPILLIFIAPIVLMLLYVTFKYKSSEVPVNLFQLIFFGYTILIYIGTLIYSF